MYGPGRLTERDIRGLFGPPDVVVQVASRGLVYAYTPDGSTKWYVIVTFDGDHVDCLTFNSFTGDIKDMWRDHLVEDPSPSEDGGIGGE